MGKKKIDIGLEYINSIGISYSRTISNMEEKLISNYGDVIGKEISNKITENDKIVDRNTQISDFNIIMNSYPDLATIWQGSCDANYVRSACNWIHKNKEYFTGNTILEVGCGFGFITPFLAKLFPDKQITAIDIDHNCVEIAEKRTNKLGLNNITYIVCSPNELTEKYDSIISARTIHEVANVEEYRFNSSPIFLMNNYSSSLTPYAHALIKCAAQDCSIISIERTLRSPLYLAWLNSLSTEKYYLLDHTSEILSLNMTNNQDVLIDFIAGIYRKSDEPKDIVKTYFEQCSKKIDYYPSTLHDEAAYMFFWKNSPKLIKGYTFKQIADQQNCTYLIADIPDLQIYVSYNFGIDRGHLQKIGYNDISLDELIKACDESVTNNKAISFVKELHSLEELNK